jgi:hypothetical protein
LGFPLYSGVLRVYFDISAESERDVKFRQM